MIRQKVANKIAALLLYPYPKVVQRSTKTPRDEVFQIADKPRMLPSPVWRESGGEALLRVERDGGEFTEMPNNVTS